MSELSRFRQALLAKREQLLREGDSQLEPSRKDPASVGTDEDEQPLTEMLQVIASKRNLERSRELGRIDAALKRLDSDPEDFGLCLQCEEEIPKRRLEAFPHVEYCVDCQSERDQPRGGARRHLTDFD